VADVFELLLCSDCVELRLGGIVTEAQFDVASAATKNGFEIFEGATGPDVDDA